MKRSYTIFSPRLKREAKLSGLTCEELILFFGNREAQTTYAWENQYQFLSLDYFVISGHATHFFLPDVDFCNWIVECVPEDKWQYYAEVLQQEVGENVASVFHFKTGQGKESCAIILPPAERIIHSKKDPGTGQMILVLSYSAHCNEKIGAVLRLDKTLKESELKSDAVWYFKLFIGLAMYIGCFPEVVKDGPPEDLKHPSNHAYRLQKTISISRSVVSGNSASPTAHFRRGHFRCLKSDKFKNKRFHVVFVRETFVNGNAKTVLTPEDVEP